MGQVHASIEVDGKTFWTSFDARARHTYITPAVARRLTTSPTPEPLRSTLAGVVHEINTEALLDARIEGHPVSALAWVVDEIGRDENGTPIEILFGALAMRQWGIWPIPDEQRLDLTHYPGVLVEF